MSPDESSANSTRTLSTLPSELLIYILTFLPYPALTNVQHTCHFFQELPPPTLVSAAQESYSSSLFDHEKDIAARLAQHLAVLVSASRATCYLPTYILNDQLNNLHKNAVTRVNSLVCYQCFSRLPRERFARTQVTKKRSYGHKDGWRRFCIACGMKRGTWARGTVLKDTGGGRIVCVRCGKYEGTDATAGRAKMCTICYAVESEETGETRGDGDERSDFVRDGSRGIKDTGKRVGRCQRCWATNHTTEAVVVRGAGGELLCNRCANGVRLQVPTSMS